MGPGGPVGLNMLAVDLAMGDYHIAQDEKIDFSTKVRRIANIIISERAEEAESERKRKKK